MKKIVIDENIPFLRGVLEPWFEVVYAGNIHATLAHDAEALLIRTRTRCDEKLLAGSSVRFIGTATIGFDHIDTVYCHAHGIEIATAAGCNARAVMQYVGSALVHLSRKQGWKPEEKTLGVIGVGHVGSLIVQLARACGFNVICCDPPKMRQNSSLGCLPLEDLLAQADIVTCHVPLNKAGIDKTLGMADERFFSRLKPGSIFINTSRGEIVDDMALKAAIRSGRLSDVVLDVWNHEPHINPELAAAVTYGTVHIAGYSIQGKANGSSMVVQALARKYGIPLTEWYPEDVPVQVIDRSISWPMLCETIDNYCDISAEDARLRGHIDRFETLRNNYTYREEYF